MTMNAPTGSIAPVAGAAAMGLSVDAEIAPPGVASALFWMRPGPSDFLERLAGLLNAHRAVAVHLSERTVLGHHGLIERAVKMTPADYVALLEKRRVIRQHCRELAAGVGADAYVTLASSGPAITGFEFSGSRTFIVYGSWLGFPAFSLPVMQSGGLPFGLQLLGIDHQDGNLCSTANWVVRELST